MERVAVFVDAGYLFVEGSRALIGRKLARSAIGLDHRSAIAQLTRLARGKSGVPLLRVYWYDATANRPTKTQAALAEQADVKLRLGRIDGNGRQKGVDALIANDLVTLARNRAMTNCVLLSGDDELRTAVSEIQQLGVRVHLLGISPARRTQSRLLRREADSTSEWGGETLARFMHFRTADGCSAGLPRPRTTVDIRTAVALRRVGRQPLAPSTVAGGVREMAQRLVGQRLLEEFAACTGGYPRSRASWRELGDDLHAELPGG